MAGTAWTHFVPFDADVDAALRRLRHEVFLAREFEVAWSLDVDAAIAMTDDEAEAGADELVGMTIDRYRHSMWADIGGARPEPRDELDRQINRVVLLSLDSGTHSVLDVAHADPVPPGQARSWFGSDRPTRRHIEDGPLNGGSLPRRWHAWVIEVDDGGGDPVELCFLGNTGD